MQDNVGLAVGNGLDFSIEHNGSNTTITESTGDLTIINTADDKDIIFSSDNASVGTAVYLNLDCSYVGFKVLTLKVMLPNLPTSYLSTAVHSWNDSLTLKISSG